MAAKAMCGQSGKAMLRLGPRRSALSGQMISVSELGSVEVWPLEDRAATSSAIGTRLLAPAALDEAVDAHRARLMYHAYVAEPAAAPASSDRREAARQSSLLS